jgi:hypothetical protein
MRAGVDAVHTECAVHVAHFAGLKEGQFAATDRDQVRDRLASAADAVFGMAGHADILFPHFYLERRKRGCDKVELSDGANEFAERSMLEKTIDHQHGDKIRDDQPRGPPGRGPKIEQLISKKDQDEERYGGPLVAQRPRPVEARLKEVLRHLAHQHERAGQAEKIPCAQQDQHQHPPKMKPAEGGSQILRRQRGTEQSMQNHHHAHDEQRQLEQGAHITPAKQVSQSGDSQQIKRLGSRCVQGRDGGWIQQLT